MNYYGYIIEPLSAGGILSSATLNRLDWFGLGAGSVSKTAAFIVLLMVASWAICSIRNKFSFWIVLLTNCILGYFLIQTYSRGSLISIIIAFATFLILAPIKFSRLKVTLVSIAVLAGVIYSNSINFTDRVGNMLRLKSSSANVRYDLYTAGLKMLTDAPDGFQAPDIPAKIYMRWYQRMYENEEYNTLVNSHLEFLNRHGIIYKFSYILFWSFIFSITFSYKKSILSSVAFSIWIAFFLNSIFSNIATFWIMWILPILYLLLVIFVNRGKFLDKRFYYTILSIFIISILTLFTTSLALNRDVNLRFQKDNVKLGTSLPSEVFIYLQNDSVLGRKYGLELIDWIKGKNLTVTIGTQPNNSILYRTMVVAGKFNTKDILKTNSERYVFLNPTFENEKDLSHFFKQRKATVIIGEVTDFRNIQLWKEFFFKYKNTNTRLFLLNSVGTYIPDWTSYIEDELYEQ